MRLLGERETVEVLCGNGLGVLSLVDDGRPYGIPMSFGFDPEEFSLVMNWGQADGGRKSEIVQSNPAACLTVYEHNAGPPRTYRSVVVVGEVEYLAGDEIREAMRIQAENAEIALDFHTWGIPLEKTEFTWIELVIDSWSGRQFGMMELA